MKTDQLIDLLSTNVEPVKSGYLKKTLVYALLIGGVAAFCVMLTTVGLRSQASDKLDPRYFILKLLFTISLVALRGPLLVNMLRPGQCGQ